MPITSAPLTRYLKGKTEETIEFAAKCESNRPPGVSSVLYAIHVSERLCVNNVSQHC